MTSSLQHVDFLVGGGGAAGYFGAITAAQARPGSRILIAERGNQPLAKVRISGGGRCNVTHACFETRPLSTRYPRGARALLSAFSRFQPTDTVQWFEQRGVPLKTEPDGRMFPTTDDSKTIIACLEREARNAGVELRLRCSIEALRPDPQGGWLADIAGSNPTVIHAQRVLLATVVGALDRLLLSLKHLVTKYFCQCRHSSLSTWMSAGSVNLPASLCRR